MKPSLSSTTTAHALSGSLALRNQIIAATLLAFATICVIAACVYLGMDEPYALAVGAGLVVLVKVDDARIRRARRLTS